MKYYISIIIRVNIIWICKYDLLQDLYDIVGIKKLSLYSRERLNDLFRNIGFEIAYTEDFTQLHNGVVTERLVTCLKK